MLMNLFLINFPYVAPVSPLSNFFYIYLSDSSGSGVFKLLVLSNMHVCVDVIIYNVLFWWQGHMIELFCL